MLSLVHRPIRDPAELDALVARGQRETVHLEFKSLIWRPASGGDGRDHMREAAKDVAALANGLGGDILIGVASKDSRATGFADWCAPGGEDRSRENLRDWLREYLQPASFKDHVETSLVAAPSKSACNRVLVVTVPPSIGLVAAVANPDDNSVRFPVRSDDGTRWASAEEAMTRFTLASRATYLKLAALLVGNETRVRIVSRFEAPVIARNGALGNRLPVPATGGAHGIAGALDETHFTFRPRPWDYNDRGWRALVPENIEIPIPLDLVRTAWHVGDAVHLALLAPLVSYAGTVVFEVP